MTTKKQQAGLTLVEVLVTMILLGIILIPAMQALQTSVVGADVHSDIASNDFRVTSRLEELLVEPFSDLADAATVAGGPTVATTYSESAGPPGRLLVFLAFYDGDNADADNNPFTGGDPDLLWISVEAEGTVHALQTISASGY